MTERELKPCPFCDGEAFLVQPPMGDPDYVSCSKCGCELDSYYRILDVPASQAASGPRWQPRKIRNAVAAWNTRADPLLQEAITLLERVRDDLLYPAEKRIKDSEITEFIEKCATYPNK